MPAKNFRIIGLLLCLLIVSLLACSIVPDVNMQGTPTTSSTAQSGTEKLNTWEQAAPGIEIRFEHWQSPGDNEDTVAITRLDLKKVHLSIGYAPTRPLDMSAWMKQTGALAMINGGYFDKNNQSTGLLVSNGQMAGSSYVGFGGMLAVDAQGNVTLRSLKQQPYDPNTEQLQQATQSSPMLMINGQRTQFEADSVSQRRSVIAIDKQGRLLLIASPNQAFTLDELADLLASSDLSIETALNLDGGASTGLYVNGPNQKISIDAFTPLPIVIIVK
ncbi:MAG TPA: phosphodiester glycosidase family protein [Ktedonobacteraceae bacterium]|jgi:exopolysaccharide biosynthesis protein|nr:phosphodiester glycosidase family protein [Ktedonobacteraceae bacterium]